MRPWGVRYVPRGTLRGDSSGAGASIGRCPVLVMTPFQGFLVEGRSGLCDLFGYGVVFHVER